MVFPDEKDAFNGMKMLLLLFCSILVIPNDTQQKSWC